MAGASMAMRSLVLLHESAVPLPQPAQLITVYGKRTIFVTGSGWLLQSEAQTADAIMDASVVRLPEFESDTPVSVQDLPDSDSVCVGCASGNIFLVTSDGLVEVAGSVDGGIRAMQWSPDGEVFAAVTGTGSVLVMTRTMDLVADVPLSVTDKGEASFVSVGWGRKETQFRGRAGKLAASDTDAPAAAAAPASADDGSVRIAWMGSGRFFAVSAVDESNGAAPSRRRARVFSRDGKLQSTSEDALTLESPLAWMPSGELLGTTQVTSAGARQVAFFERNGLSHGGFPLRSPLEHHVVDMQWNADSTVLAVLLVDGRDARHHVQLWTMANYHYYLKQEFVYSDGEAPTFLFWDPERPLVLHICTQDALYRQMTFTTDVLTDERVVRTNAGMVAVVDGGTILWLLCACYSFFYRPAAPDASQGGGRPAARVAAHGQGRRARPPRVVQPR